MASSTVTQRCTLLALMIVAQIRNFDSCRRCCLSCGRMRGEWEVQAPAAASRCCAVWTTSCALCSRHCRLPTVAFGVFDARYNARHKRMLESRHWASGAARAYSQVIPPGGEIARLREAFFDPVSARTSHAAVHLTSGVDPRLHVCLIDESDLGNPARGSYGLFAKLPDDFTDAVRESERDGSRLWVSRCTHGIILDDTPLALDNTSHCRSLNPCLQTLRTLLLTVHLCVHSHLLLHGLPQVG